MCPKRFKSIAICIPIYYIAHELRKKAEKRKRKSLYRFVSMECTKVGKYSGCDGILCVSNGI